MPVSDIKIPDLKTAAQEDDVNAAASALQRIAGITDGGVAGQCLPDQDEWGPMRLKYRMGELVDWLCAERAYEFDREEPEPRCEICGTAIPTHDQRLCDACLPGAVVGGHFLMAVPEGEDIELPELDPEERCRCGKFLADCDC